MKVVFSRKGFDAGYGGMASPILPDGRLLPLPIPSSHDGVTMGMLEFPGIDLDQVLRDLSGGRHTSRSKVHFDPDLGGTHVPGIPGWRPALGQTGAAQSHLANNGVGPGDVFLFFGWFRQIDQVKSQWRFVPGAPDLHVIFGWLETEDVLAVVKNRAESLEKYPWISAHPHVVAPHWYDSERNHVYVARERSAYSSGMGGGRFPRLHPGLKLTQDGMSRSNWALPGWFEPRGRQPLTYHPNPVNWRPDGDRVNLKTAAKGQEFVIDSKAYPELEGWVGELIQRSA